MTKIRFVLAVAFFCILSSMATSCATSTFARTGPKTPEYHGIVRVLYEMPQTPYREVGIITSEGGMAHNWSHLIKALQKKAAKKGANAIVISQPMQNQQTFLAFVPQNGVAGGTSPIKTMMALAIWLEP